MADQTTQKAGDNANQVGRDVHGGIHVITSGIQTAMYLFALLAIISMVSMFGIFGLIALPTSSKPVVDPTITPTTPQEKPSVAEVVPTNTATTLPTTIPTNTPQPTSTPTETPVPIVPTKPPVSQNCSRMPNGTFASVWQEFQQKLGCPVSSQVTIPRMVKESFEGGHLFWRSDTNDVYVIYDRQKENGSELWEGKWITDPTWSWAKAGEPDPDGIGLSPPPGLIEPKRGFGWLWRNFLGRENGLLGWALDKEYPFDNTSIAQNCENGIMFKDTSKVYLLLNDGTFLAR